MSQSTNCILAFSLLGIGVIGVAHILILLGRNNTAHQEYFRWVHRICGYIFFVLYLFICVIMFQKLTRITTSLSAEDAIHAYMGIAIFFTIVVKICIVRVYKKFYKSLPIYGMITLIAVYLTATLNAAHYIISTFRD
ncbi:MAG TPA: DUF6529 family protein [Candidatus Brocadiaceae bacterium]